MNIEDVIDENVAKAEMKKAHDLIRKLKADLAGESAPVVMVDAVAKAVEIVTVAVLVSPAIGGAVPAAMLMDTEDGPTLADVANAFEENSTLDKRDVLRAILKTTGTTTFALISEAWAIKGDKAESAYKAGLERPISERDDRVSTIVINAEHKASGLKAIVMADIEEGENRRINWDEATGVVLPKGSKEAFGKGQLFGLFEGIDEWDETETLEAIGLDEVRGAA